MYKGDVLTEIKNHSNSPGSTDDDNSSRIEVTTFLHKTILHSSIALLLIPTLRARWFSLDKVLL